MRTGWSLGVMAFFGVAASLAFGQGASGTITGTITDPAGAVIPGASVQAKNTATGVAFTGATTSTGDYTIPGLPVGVYTITVTVSGFKTYTHTNLAVQATQILRENIPLQIGNTGESVTVTAEASQLKTESAELSHDVSIDQLDQMPLLGVGSVNAGSSGYRNPYNTLLTLPGISSYASSGTFVLNGLGGTTAAEAMRIEGQDSTNRVLGATDYTQMTQPSADAIQEMAYQTSNYAPEFGTAGSVVINMTMKSGTNQYHGSGYDYFVNEDLNAGYPFTVSGGPGSSSGGAGGKFRPRNRRNDFGGTLGGPVYIPKIYNGHNKTFWFFNYEQYLETTLYTFSDTVPTLNYQQGNFSQISPNGSCSLCAQYGIPTTPLGGSQLDPLGRPLFANTIYDPNSRAQATSGPLAGQGYATPFQNNSVPLTSFDAVSAKLIPLFPQPTNGNLTQNYNASIPGGRYSAIPSIKIDHSISAKDKLSFYYSENNTQSQISQTLGNADGLPLEIGGYRGTFIPTYTERLNYDRTLTPTLLLHLGAGMLWTQFLDHAPFLNFNPSAFGLSGFLHDRQFPSFTEMNYPVNPTTLLSQYGGMQNIGTAGQGQSLDYEQKPSFNANVTWAHGPHTYKAGAEVLIENIFTQTFSGVTEVADSTTGGATAQPFTPANSLNGFTQGFGYANFLLGDYSSSTQTSQPDPKEKSYHWAMFAQDSWKVTRKLTLDYGLRYDLGTVNHEQYGRLGQLNETQPNMNAGGHPGTYQYASSCNCQFYQKNYPYGFGPRIGVAYQINPKTVFRAGWGLTYTYIVNNAGATVATNGIFPLATTNPTYVPSTAQYVNAETPGFIQTPVWPVTNPQIYPVPGTTGNGPNVPDPNQNRPGRINQFSAGFQREITKSLVVEATYVANRAAWIQQPGGPLGFFSQLSPATYAKYGFFPYPGTGPCATAGGICASSTYNNNADRILLADPISSSAVTQALAARGISSILPYAGFPTSNTLQSALYAFPQFTSTTTGPLAVTGSPTGDSKYDSLQVKATKRISHNFAAGGAFTWGQGFTRAARQDFFNPASAVWALQQIPPRVLTFNATYTVPRASYLPRIANAFTKDWQIGWFSTYQTAPYLTPPTSPTANFLTSEDVPVAGQSFYNVNINNIHSYNPLTTQVLNPNAWTACPTNTTCEATGNLYKNFRGPRTPSENANIGRNFRIKESMNFQIRGEFVNIFNRTLMPTGANISTANPQNLPVKNAQGAYTSGFGIMPIYVTPNTAEGGSQLAYLQPRTGTLIMRFSF